MNPGRFDKRVTILRAPVLPGNKRGKHEPAGTLWAMFEQASGRTLVEAGRAVDAVEGVLTVRDSARARLIEAADRLLLNGREYGIGSVGEPERRARVIRISVSRRQGA